MQTLALSLQILLLAYHQATTLFDFYPFNAVRFYKPHEKYLEAALNFILMALAPAGFILGLRGLVAFSAVYYFALLGAECATWWAPYFFGPSPKWAEIYARVQGNTITPLPRRGANPTPNLEHLILMALTLAAALATWPAAHALPGVSFQNLGWYVLGGAVLALGALYQCCLQGRGRRKPGMT